MRILGIDYGTKRIGLAVSDELEILAREFGILSPKEFFQKIKEIIETNEIGQVVIGLPLNMDGKDSEKTLEAREFADKIKKTLNIPVILKDERLSSKFAEKLPGGKTNTDSLAAQIILQNYLDTNKNKSN